ncbi:hypothetical protein H9L05_18285 [Hymenobacter qilianensis]|uniref:Uncharacterized protein n=1 Tax=Hymenobacter qilianensis TaxID=1385715 RepID=A0A7H0GU97_9BACT|nr:hypothetical protein [Hymenobacter qilianensis]QNP51863.1 hypothetical protein H9L05_18285 [Hymenobacter qilianensis]
MFTFLKQLLSQRSAPNRTDWQPAVRTPAQVKRHEQWLADRVYLNWAGPYFKAYHFRKAGVGSSQGLRVQLITDCGRQGAIFFFDPSIGPGNFRHFFDFTCERVLELGYNLSTSDQRKLVHPSYTETIDKHFLKPQPKDCSETGRCNQRYGSITIDLISINEQPGFIRFFANPYHDDIFTPAHSFDELIAAVYQLPPPMSRCKPALRNTPVNRQQKSPPACAWGAFLLPVRCL